MVFQLVLGILPLLSWGGNGFDPAFEALFNSAELFLPYVKCRAGNRVWPRIIDYFQEILLGGPKRAEVEGDKTQVWFLFISLRILAYDPSLQKLGF